VSSPNYDDPLFRFSHRLFQTKFVIFELVMAGFSVFGMYSLAAREFGFDGKLPTPSPPSVSSPRMHSCGPAEPSSAQPTNPVSSEELFEL
jgi:hypothetical protein